MLPPPSAPPGWYADPTGTGVQRFWDGSAWVQPSRPSPLPRRRSLDRTVVERLEVHRRPRPDGLTGFTVARRPRPAGRHAMDVVTRCARAS